MKKFVSSVSSFFNHSDHQSPSVAARLVGHLDDGDGSEEVPSGGYDMKTRATLSLAVVYVFICVVGFTANAAVLFMIARSRRSRAVTNIYIFNLALADLLYAICLPAAIYQMLNGQWTLGHTMCKFYYTCDGVSKFASVMFLVILSFDRYVAVCHAIRCRAVRTPKLAFVTTGLAWTLVIVAMVPVYLHATLLEVTEGGVDTSQCVIYWPPANNGLNDTAYYDETTPDFVLRNESDFHPNDTQSRRIVVVGPTSPLPPILPLPDPPSYPLEEPSGPGPLTNWSRRIFTLYLFTLSFLAPLAMVWIFYTMILGRLRAQKKRLFSNTLAPHQHNDINAHHNHHQQQQQSQGGGGGSADDEATCMDDDDVRIPSSNRQKRPMLTPPVVVTSTHGVSSTQRRNRSTKRVTIMVLSIVICYTVCWIPYWFVQLTVEFFPDSVQPVFGYEVFTIISYFSYGMQSVNSMMNPFLYAFGTQTHRRRLLTRYRRFFGLVGCRWRFFGLGSSPPDEPRDSLIRGGARTTAVLVDDDVSCMESCARRQQQETVFGGGGGTRGGQNGADDRLHPRSASSTMANSNQRRAVVRPSSTATAGYGGGENQVSRSAAKPDHCNQAPFAYCLCCYCEPIESPVVQAPKKTSVPKPSSLAKNTTGPSRTNKEAVSRDRHHRDEEEEVE